MFKNKETWQSWSSWSSPVGLGIFYFLTALAIVVLLYTLLNVIVTVATVAHPEFQAYPTNLEGSGMMQTAPSTSTGGQ